MEENKQLSDRELALADKIVKFLKMMLKHEYPYMSEVIDLLTPMYSYDIEYIGANLKYLFYNPYAILKKYKNNEKKLKQSILHCVLHCLYLHPVTKSINADVYEIAADLSVISMLCEDSILNEKWESKYKRIMKKINESKTDKIFSKLISHERILAEAAKYVCELNIDDHSVWYTIPKDCENRISKPGSDDCIDIEELASLWKIKKEQLESIYGSKEYGSVSGNLFMGKIEKPSRFSKFSYRQYLKRFLQNEAIEEDPETLDTIMYTFGMDMYDDMPIVEYSEIKEFGRVDNIIIAIDMSGSCGDKIAENFLRQVYTIFEELDLKSRCNIRVVRFDVDIIDEYIINKAADAENMLNNYDIKGLGGTSFKKVFKYADKFNKKSKLKGLLFFSDTFGSFPESKREYPTIFFVPEVDFVGNYDHVPDWIELVKYDDNNSDCNM